MRRARCRLGRTRENLGRVHARGAHTGFRCASTSERASAGAAGCWVQGAPSQSSGDPYPVCLRRSPRGPFSTGADNPFPKNLSGEWHREKDLPPTRSEPVSRPRHSGARKANRDTVTFKPSLLRRWLETAQLARQAARRSGPASASLVRCPRRSEPGGAGSHFLPWLCLRCRRFTSRRVARTKKSDTLASASTWPAARNAEPRRDTADFINAAALHGCSGPEDIPAAAGKCQKNSLGPEMNRDSRPEKVGFGARNTSETKGS